MEPTDLEDQYERYQNANLEEALWHLFRLDPTQTKQVRSYAARLGGYKPAWMELW